MRTLERTSAFKKSFKQLQKRGKDESKLMRGISLLADTQILSNGSVVLPEKYRNHKLSGKYAGMWECHIEPDWLLVYQIDEYNLLLVNTGSHSDIF